MSDPNLLLAVVIQQAKALNIPVSAQIDPQVQLNCRATTRFGCCHCRNGRFTIELSARLLDAPELSCLQTLAHEVLHTCPGCRNHGPLWKGYAARMNAAYGYAISRTGSCEALGIPDTRPVRHMVVCQRCGREFPRARESAMTRHPERYRCRCGGTLKRLY